MGVLIPPKLSRNIALLGSYVDLKSRSGPSRNLRYSPFENGWSFFVGLSMKSLWEELNILNHSAKHILSLYSWLDLVVGALFGQTGRVRKGTG